MHIAFNINYDDAYIFVFLIFLMALLFSKQKTKISRLTISFKFLILYKIVRIIVMLKFIYKYPGLLYVILIHNILITFLHHIHYCWTNFVLYYLSLILITFCKQTIYLVNQISIYWWVMTYWKKFWALTTTLPKTLIIWSTFVSLLMNLMYFAHWPKS